MSGKTVGEKVLEQRGIERRNIFKDNTDRNRFLERLGSVLQKTSTPCYGCNSEYCPVFNSRLC
jgi:hypothetical protein